MNLNIIVEVIQKRPLMYIHSEDIFVLQDFIQGYLIGREERLEDYERYFKDEFNTWVANYYYGSPSAQRWAYIIFFFEKSHENSLKKFWVLYDEFMRVRKHENTLNIDH